jgi:hypothetical protein
VTCRSLLILVALMGCVISASPALTQPASSFGYVDVFLDPQGKPLAAWQIQVIANDDCAALVGVEGGETAFKDPPHYDPAALDGNRIIIAAYSTAQSLPNAKTRVARLHLQFRRPTRSYDIRLVTAATSDGTKLDADSSLSEGVQP